MRLLKIEAYKIWSSVYFRLIVLILVAGNVFLLWIQSNVSIYESKNNAWKEMTIKFEKMSMKEKGDFLQASFERISAIHIINSVLQMRNLIDLEYYMQLKQKNQNVFDEYMETYVKGNYLEYMDSIEEEYIFFTTLKKEYISVQNYEKYVEDIHQKAKLLSETSIFRAKENDLFIQRCILQADEKYQLLRDIEIDYVPQKGLMTALNFKMTDVFMIVYLFLISAFMFQTEYENGMLKLVYTMPGGRLKTAGAKFLVMAVSVAVMTAVLYGSNFWFCDMKFGLGDIRRSIQSVPDLKQCLLRISVLEYILMFIAIKYAAMVIIGTLILMITVKVRTVHISVLLSIFLVGVQEIIKLFIAPASGLSLLRYITMFSLLESNKILGNYVQLNFFGYPVMRFNVELFIGGIWLYVLLVCYFFATVNMLFESGNSKDIRLKISQWLVRKYKFRNLICHEGYKIFYMQRCGLLIILFLIFSVYQGNTCVNMLNAEEVIYKNYVEMVGGQFTKEKAELLQKENEKFEPIYELEDMFEQRKIDEVQFSGMMEYYNLLNYQKNIFDNFYKFQFQYLAEHPYAQIVYSKGYECLFDKNESKDGKTMIVTLFFICLLFCGFFSIEKNTGMIKIIAVTPRGKKDFVQAKTSICFWTSMVMAMISLCPSYIVSIRDYGLHHICAPAQSILMFEHIFSGVPLIGMMLLQFLMRWIACFAVSVIVSYISWYTGKALLSLFLNIVLFCLCPLFALNGFEKLWWFSFYPLFHGIAEIGHGLFVWVILLYFVSAITLIAGFRHTYINVR